MISKGAPAFSFEGRTVEATVRSAYDGDTITAEFAVPMHPDTPEYSWKCRLAGIDTPEIRDKRPEVKAKAYAARDRLRAIVLGRRVTLELGKTDKYGRTLVRVFDGATDVNELLVREGLARRYDGGRREPW